MRDRLGRHAHVRVSPDQQYVAFDSDRGGTRGVYVARVNGTYVRRVSGEGYAAMPSWSPDGRLLAFIKADAHNPDVWNLWTVNVATGRAVRVTGYAHGRVSGASWLPSGDRLCFAHEDRLIVQAPGAAPLRIYPVRRKGAAVSDPTVSPDGKRVAFRVAGEGIWLLDLARGSMRQIAADARATELTWTPDGRRVAYRGERDEEAGVWVVTARE